MLERAGTYDGDRARIVALANMLNVEVETLESLDPVVASEMIVAERCKLMPEEMRIEKRFQKPGRVFKPVTLRKAVGKRTMSDNHANARLVAGGRRRSGGRTPKVAK